MDVGGWLRGLGLGQYEEQFRDNKIDADLLPRLTVDDLKDIGVSLVGDRRRLLDAIAVIAGAGRPSDLPAFPTKSAPSKGPQASAERRPITVMFCDLVGSTNMAAKLDAEDWRTLVNTYLDEASAAVTGLGGHVLKKLGDGLMALFGYPHAQENDAERAVRAALAIQRALIEINARNAGKGAPELSARVGLDSGQVVVDATGEVFGDAPNIAARVQGAAEPGSILITAAIQRQTAGQFVSEDRGQHELKGMSATMTLYRIVRASGGGRRGGARVLTPLVGREEELDLLARRWERARKGEGQLALVVGEPGLGKSRLMEEFHGRLGETPHTWVEWSSSQLLQNTPFHPIAEWGRQRFGADVPAERRLADLENTLQVVGLDPTEYTNLLAPLVDVLLPEDRVAKLAPEELRRRQMAAMTAWILAAARTQAIVLGFEDLHWADPTSLDLMRALAERGAQAPLLIIATARPEFRPPWSVRSHHSVISLPPLDSVQIAKMVRELSSRHALPKDIVEGVSERTGGVPLFVEEVTRLLLERGEQGGAQAIPPTLQQSLAARLDRLGSAREAAQIGAVLGRGFSYALLQSVAGLDEGALQSALERLTEADILFVEGHGTLATYRFKHALIQDAAYDSLLKSRRQALHRRAAEALRDDPERASAEPELIAHHFTQAGLDNLAIEWWGKAGDQALRRSAFQEAIAHLGRAIEMADKTAAGTQGPEAAVPSSQRLKLQTDYGQALMWSKGFSAKETRAAFARVTDFAATGEDATVRFAAYDAECQSSFVRGEYNKAQEIAEIFLREAEAEDRATEAGAARRALGFVLLFQGNLRAARSILERALTDYRPERDGDTQRRFNRDTEVTSAAYLALAEWHLGEVERARLLIERSIRRANELGHAAAIANALMWRTILESRRNDAPATRLAAEAVLEVSENYGIKNYADLSRIYAAWARGRLQDPEVWAEELERVLSAFRAEGHRVEMPSCYGMLAELETLRRGAEKALALVSEGLAISKETGERITDSYLYRLRGDILVTCDPADRVPAEKAYRTAIAVANEQGARSFELRAALALAKLYQSTGRSTDAYTVLAPALEGFASTPEMPEIAEAQALLAALDETGEVKDAAASRLRRLQLQTSYSQAVMWSRGYGSDEAKAAFAHAQELATGVDNAAERFDAYYGLFIGSLVRGELRSARETAEKFVREAEKEERITEAAAARRTLGVACLLQGDLAEARAHFEQALWIFDPERDREAKFRFGPDVGAAATGYLAVTNWLLGEAGPARKLMEESISRAIESAHAPTLANAYWVKAVFDAFRDDAEAGRRAAESLLEVSRGHGLGLYLASGALFSSWAHGRLGDWVIGMAELRKALTAYADQGNKMVAPFFQGRLAELAEERGAEGPLARIDEALALARQTGERWTDAFLHRIRADILLKADPTNPVRAEKAYLAAIAIARGQGARTFGLQAGLKLAKLYQSTGRSVEAQGALAPALEGFSPTSEMPEIAEAQALLTALAATDEVKVAAAPRANALWAARGVGAPETTAAFARARESAYGDKDAPDRLPSDFGLWASSYIRGELPSMQAYAAAFLSDLEARPDSPEASVAHRTAGITCWFAGDYHDARDRLERALALFQPGRDDDLAYRFGWDPGVAAMANLAAASWPLGEVDRAISLIDQMKTRVAGLTHVSTLASGKLYTAMFELMRGDHLRATPSAFEMVRLAREQELPLFRAFGVFLEGWASAASGASGRRLEDMRRGVEQLREQNVLFFDGLLKIALAEAEARAGDPDRAVAILDEALATADRLGYRAFEAELHRARGDALLMRDPTALAPAEEALLTAIGVAKQQGTRSFELRAALALAKLYQSTNRPADAHTVLAPALDGFTPTSQMPEIAEAQALLAAIGPARM